MGLFVSERARRDGRATFPQLIGGLIAFVVLSVVAGILLAGLALPAVTVAGNTAQGASDLFEELPGDLDSVNLSQSSNIYARDGQTLIATFYSQNRVVVPLEEISPWLQKAVVAVEDARFWEHNGVDGQSILRAVRTNLTSDSTEGGSTLTQQVVKNTLLQKAIDAGDEAAIKEATASSYERKIKEWRLALALEEKLNEQWGTNCTDAPEVNCGKEAVLEQYLNIAQFGTNTYGVEAASQYYFSKPAAEVNALEAATIAGITQNPSKFDPTDEEKRDSMTERRNLVLKRMKDQDLITQAEYDEYVATPIADYLHVSQPKVSCSASELAPFFCDYVTKIIKKGDVFNGEGTDLLYNGGLDIVTTLDPTKQQIANEELRNSLPIDDPSGWAMAMVSLDSSSGQILAMSQTREFDPSEETPNSTSVNYSTDYEYGNSRGFSPGSTFKPVILATWLQSGRSLNQTVRSSEQTYTPSNWATPSCTSLSFAPWTPGNVEGSGFGSSMSVLSATYNSVNTAFANMASQLDICDIVSMAQTLGFHRADGADIGYNPSIALGTEEASPLTMASVFQTFANDGVHCEPYAILSITDSEGNVPKLSDGSELVLPGESCERVIDEDIAIGVQYAMSKVLTDGTAKKYPLANGRQAAGKTGTSQWNRYLWFVGYTPELSTAVWLGNPDHPENGQNITLNGVHYNYIYGSDVSAPTWKRYMDRALDGVENTDFIQFPSNDVYYGTPQTVPNVIGMSESQARATLAAAGFRTEASTIYSTLYSEGTVAAQSPSGSSKALPGSTITYYLATTTLPDWWYNWPSGWDPNVAPEDYWGSTWPPAEFTTNPPNGWPLIAEPTEPTTDPGNSGDTPGGGSDTTGGGGRSAADG